MKVQIEAIQFTASQQLIDYVQNKVSKLTQYFDRIIDTEVHLSFDSKAHPVKEKVTKIKINVPHQQLIATSAHKTFEESVDDATEAILKQLKKHKEKLQA